MEKVDEEVDEAEDCLCLFQKMCLSISTVVL